MKGYLTHKHTIKAMSETKINSCFAYFKQVQKQREICARQIIRYYVLKYFLKRKAQKKAEAERKAKELADAKKKAAQANTKGKSSYNSTLKRKTIIQAPS